MSLHRTIILSKIKEVLQTITEVKTVVRTYKDIDLQLYKTTDLPLIEIREPVETTASQMTSMRAMMDLGISLVIHFVSWSESPTTEYEALTKKIRDKIGNDFKLDNTVTAIWVQTVTIVDGTMPVYKFGITLMLRYYLDQENV